MSAATIGLRERNKQRRVGQILEATRTLLREQPGESPSVERIAARAEVAPATVFNLIGPREKIWAALADELLADLDRRAAELPQVDPHARARGLASATVDIICADAAVYRHVLANWTRSGRLLRHDPTSRFIDCLSAGRDEGLLRHDLELPKIAEMIATTCTGAAHQWAAGMISERRLRERCLAAVDIAFAAAATENAPDYMTDLLG